MARHVRNQSMTQFENEPEVDKTVTGFKKLLNHRKLQAVWLYTSITKSCIETV